MARSVQTRGRGAARNKATAAGHPAAAEGGKGEQCSEEVTVKETVSRRVSRRGAVSQTVAVEIKVEEDVKVTQRTRRNSLLPFRANSDFSYENSIPSSEREICR